MGEVSRLPTEQTNCMNGGWKVRSPLHFALPAAPEKPIDLQITAAAPELRPLLQIGSHTPSIRISGRPLPEMDGDPSPALHVQAQRQRWAQVQRVLVASTNESVRRNAEDPPAINRTAPDAPPVPDAVQ